MLKKLYYSRGDQLFQILQGITSLYDWGRKHLFIDQGGIIWNRGGNFSKFINRGSHRGTSHRGPWTGFPEQVVDLSEIYSDLLAGENRSSKMDTSPPNLSTNSAHSTNDFGSPNGEGNKPLLSIQDKKILSNFGELEQVGSTSTTNSDQISRYFCSGAKAKKSCQIWE